MSTRRKQALEDATGAETKLLISATADEGLYGPVYRVCGACRSDADKEARRELEEYDDWGDYE